jgi:hypothetical protein
MDKEIWKPIKGFEGKYEISNQRRVKSMQRITLDGRLLREKMMTISKNGKYDVVCLHKNGKTYHCYLDRLMYDHFGS